MIEITLRMDDTASVERAAQFCAELARQNVAVKAVEDFGRHPSGLHAAPSLTVTITGY